MKWTSERICMVRRMQKNSKLINMRKTLEITRNQEISLFYRYYFDALIGIN